MSFPSRDNNNENYLKFKISKVLFFLAAFFSFLFSVFLYFQGNKTHGIFVGVWVPSILSAGSLYLTSYNEK